MAEKRYRCVHCPYVSNLTSSFKLHMKQHTGKDWGCSICPYRAINKFKLKQHMKLHTAEKNFYCDRCNFGTVYRESMRAHLMVHSGLKPYKCSLNDYSSASKEHVKRHIRQRHDGSEAVTIIDTGLRLEVNLDDYRTKQPNEETLNLKTAIKSADIVDHVEHVELSTFCEVVNLNVEDQGAAQLLAFSMDD